MVWGTRVLFGSFFLLSISYLIKFYIFKSVSHQWIYDQDITKNRFENPISFNLGIWSSRSAHVSWLYN
jgi:hypothetical protein